MNNINGYHVPNTSTMEPTLNFAEQNINPAIQRQQELSQPYYFQDYANAIANANLRINEQVQIENHKSLLKYNELEHKKAIEIELINHKEKLREKHELLTFSVDLFEDGFFYKSLIDAEGKVKSSKRLVNVRALHLTTYVSCKTKEKTYAFSWEGCETEVYIAENKLKPQKLINYLSHFGISIVADRKYHAQLSIQLFASLVRLGRTEVLPHSWGWQIWSEEKWRFVDENELTYVNLKRRNAK